MCMKASGLADMYTCVHLHAKDTAVPAELQWLNVCVCVRVRATRSTVT